ncbi:MAG: N-formylglutamate amidohydrolase, partial [Actinobacteria bacterium]|nr:N-formylglutamate amidohydrolase [Actinomycetota bacterium]
LEAHGRCLIIDLHSYPASQQTYEQASGPRPELCLGTDEFHTPEDLAVRVETIAATHGLEVRRNTPFAGTLVPMKHYRSDARVTSLMMEWRRDLYRTQGRSDPAALNKLRAVVAQVIAVEALDSPNRRNRKEK